VIRCYQIRDSKLAQFQQYVIGVLYLKLFSSLNAILLSRDFIEPAVQENRWFFSGAIVIEFNFDPEN